MHEALDKLTLEYQKEQQQWRDNDHRRCHDETSLRATVGELGESQQPHCEWRALSLVTTSGHNNEFQWKLTLTRPNATNVGRLGGK